MIAMMITWLLTTAAILLSAKLLPGVQVKSFATAVAVAAVFGVLNALLGQLLFLTLGVLSLGIGFLLSFLTRWVVNTLMLRLTDALFDNFQIQGWGLTAVVAVIIAVVGSVGRSVLTRGSY